MSPQRPDRGAVADVAVVERPGATSDPREELLAWLRDRSQAERLTVTRVPFREVERWSFEEGTGRFRHDSGRFFSVEALEVTTNRGWQQRWTQPILVQPEVGFLGLLVRRVGDVVEALVQAKVEPGNIDKAQLSPTVQATRSNVLGVHRGAAVRLIEHFNGERPGRTVVDVLQSEQGSWFLRKRNRNIVVEVTGEVAEHPRFRWVPLTVLRSMLSHDNVVNMDLRSVLACLPVTGDADSVGALADHPDGGPVEASLLASLRGSGPTVHTTDEVLAWITDVRSRRELLQRLRPLRAVEAYGWAVRDDVIEHLDGTYFSVVGISVGASDREVARWSQPIVAAASPGLLALVVREVEGVLHALVQLRTQAGGFDVAELAPTVHCQPANYDAVPPEHRPPFLDLVQAAAGPAVLFDSWQSEEGGRFLHIQNRYAIVQAPPDLDTAAAPDHRWVSLAQITALLRHSGYVTVELRTMVACAMARSEGSRA